MTRKWRPALWMVVAAILAIVVALPLSGLVSSCNSLVIRANGRPPPTTSSKPGSSMSRRSSDASCQA